MKTVILISSLALALVSCTKVKVNKPGSEANADAKPYPLEVCIVSGEKLGSMGDPVVIVHEGQQIKFCCDHCIPEFNKEPEKYLSKLSGK